MSRTATHMHYDQVTDELIRQLQIHDSAIEKLIRRFNRETDPVKLRALSAQIDRLINTTADTLGFNPVDCE